METASSAVVYEGTDPQKWENVESFSQWVSHVYLTSTSVALLLSFLLDLKIWNEDYIL